MNHSGETIELKPSFLRWSLWFIALFVVVSVFGYFLQGYLGNLWWSRHYIVSLLIPLVIMLLVAWFAFVPATLEFSSTEFTIKFPFREGCTLSWDELDLYYRVWGNVLMIQFETGQTFQILPYAYSREQWQQFMNFLSTRFPDNKASGDIGGTLFKWRRRKKS